jgi:hypothetical protein
MSPVRRAIPEAEAGGNRDRPGSRTIRKRDGLRRICSMDLPDARPPAKVGHDPSHQPQEGCMSEAMHLRMFGPWQALQQLVAGRTMTRI